MIQIILSLALAFHLYQEGSIGVASPQPGEELRGRVEIRGNMDVPNFSSAELAFAYASDPTDTWFTIEVFLQPVAELTLTVWDTTLLTDGDYKLRLRVFLLDGTTQEVMVPDVKIRNDAPPVTQTPELAQSVPSTSSRPTPTLQPGPPDISFPTPTALSPNPASLTASSVYSTFGRGVLVVLLTYAFIALIIRLRRN
jgi:hypothetical protein